MDSGQSLYNVSTSVVGDDYKYAFSRNWGFDPTIDADSSVQGTFDVDDELLVRGNVRVIWAVGPPYDTLQHTLPLQKHKPLGNPEFNGFTTLPLCPAVAQIRSTTESRTSSTVTTLTSSTRTQTTSTTSTQTSSTTAQPLPTFTPIPPPLVTEKGYIDFKSIGTHHPHQQGLLAHYFKYDDTGDQLDKHCSAHCASQRNWYHGANADAVAIIPNVNFPGHVRHNMSSPFSENFASLFQGFIEIPEDGDYEFEMTCSDGCFLFANFTGSDDDMNRGTHRVISGATKSTGFAVTNTVQGLTAGHYQIAIMHVSTVNETGSVEDLRYGLGFQCVFKWTTPSLSKRLVPPWALSHRSMTSSRLSTGFGPGVLAPDLLDTEPRYAESTHSSAYSDRDWAGMCIATTAFYTFVRSAMVESLV